MTEKNNICESLQEELSSKSLNPFPDFPNTDKKQKQMAKEIKELNKEVEGLTSENLSLLDKMDSVKKEVNLSCDISHDTFFNNYCNKLV